MPPIVGELLFVALLIVANGVFAMSEMAIVSARKARLQQQADEGDRRARVVLGLASTPNRFLSTVQIGITLIGILAGAYSGATLSGHLAVYLRQVRFLVPVAEGVSLVVTVLGVTYCSLVIGELVPKRLGMHSPERIALAVAGTMHFLSYVALPAVKLLSFSTELALRLMGVGPSTEPPVTEEEIKVLLEQGTEAGVFQEVEQDMVKSVLLLDERRAVGLMTPRPDIVWLDLDDSPEEIRRKIIESPYSRFPVAQGSLDNILGEVEVRDLLARGVDGKPFELKDLLQRPTYVPEVMPALKVLEAFKMSGTQMALVIDEYGSVQGLVTQQDILEAIVGDIPTAGEPSEPQAVRREDGSWLMDGMLAVEEFKDILQLRELPGEDQGLYQTLAGFVMMQLGKIPAVADHFEWNALRFEVVDMDGNRIDKVLVAPLPRSPEASGTGTA